MLFLVLFAVLTLATPLSAQTTLSDADMDAAIAAGTKGGAPRAVGCYADVRFAEAIATDYSKGYSVILRGPFSNIASKAAEAKQKYLKFTREDVTDEMKLQALFVAVHPSAPEFSNKAWQRASPATHFVVRIPSPDKKAEPTIIQPKKVETFPVNWTNGFGMKFDSQGLIALFDMEAVPVGQDVEFVVITEHGERDCKLSKNDRARVK